MTEKMINELMKNHEDTVKNSKLADVVVVKKPGKDPELIRGEQIDREVVNLGLFLELCDLGDTGLIAVYDSRKSFDISGKKYVFGTVIVVHKGRNGTECMTEEEICRAVITLMDSEVTLSYDGEDFKAYEIG